MMGNKQKLIDANALAEHIKDLPTWWADDGGYYGGAMKYPEGLFHPEDVLSSIENAPTVDAAPVVHGHWIEHPNVEIVDGKRISNYECSECLCWYRTHENYCGECGAKMDGE